MIGAVSRRDREARTKNSFRKNSSRHLHDDRSGRMRTRPVHSSPCSPFPYYLGRRCRLLVLICGLAFTTAAHAQQALVTVVPEETDELLANPGVGWETFHRTSKQDRNLPSWIPSTLHYARWGWGELEPKEDAIDYAFLDRVLKDTHDSAQKLGLPRDVLLDQRRRTLSSGMAPGDRRQGTAVAITKASVRFRFPT